MWNRDGFDTEKDENLVEGREVGDKMREYCRDARDEFSVDESEATDTCDPEGLTEAEEPVDRDFVLYIVLIALEGSVMPSAHRKKETKSEGDWDPCSFEKFD